MYYKPSIYDVIKIYKGNVGIGTNSPQNSLHIAGSFGLYKDGIAPVLQTTSSGLEIGQNLAFANRPLGLGIETEVLGSNAVFVLNENIPRSYIHIDDPSNGLNPWVVAVDGDHENPSGQADIVRSVHVGRDGTVYTTSEFDNNFTTIFRNPDGTQSTIEGLIYSNISRFAIVSSYQPGGELNWHRVIATSNEITSGFMYAPTVVSDVYGNVFVAGNGEAAMVVYDSNQSPWWNSLRTCNENHAANGSGGYLLKYDSDGNPVWVSFFGCTTQASVYNHTLDETSNAIYLVGHAYPNQSGDNLTFYNPDGSQSSNQITTTNSDCVGLVIKYDLNGAVQWVNTIDGVSNDVVIKVDVDMDHNVVFASMLTFANNSSNVVMQSQDTNHLTIQGLNGNIIGKFDAQGNAIWGVNISTQAGVDQVFGKIQNVRTRGNDIFVVMEGDSNNDHDIVITNANGTNVNIAIPEPCFFVIKLNADGIYQWHTRISPCFAVGNDRYLAIHSGLTFDSLGNIYITPFIHQYGSDNAVIVYNPDGSFNVVPVREDLNFPGSEYNFHSYAFKLNPNGYFLHRIAHIGTSGYGVARSMDVALDEMRHRLYMSSWGVVSTFNVNNREGDLVYSFSNLDFIAGFVLALDLDSGNIVKPGITLKLPAQESDHFHKDIFLTTTKTTPYTAYLHLENRDHTYKYIPITLEQSNVTVQKSFRWTSNAWVQSSQFEPTAQGVNLVDYYYGDQSFTSASSNYIGANIAWQNKTQDNKMAFRVTTKCSLASDEEIAYRQFETLVSPIANENSNMPYGIVSSEVGDTYGSSFSNLHHTITRHSDHSVDLKVHWDTSSINYVGNLELHVLATTRLGDITFAPLHG